MNLKCIRFDDIKRIKLASFLVVKASARRQAINGKTSAYYGVKCVWLYFDV
jgi:hypothetical protein